jgi:hypothetical protein
MFKSFPCFIAKTIVWIFPLAMGSLGAESRKLNFPFQNFALPPYYCYLLLGIKHRTLRQDPSDDLQNIFHEDISVN